MKRILTKIAGIINTILFGLLAAGCSLIFGLILSGSATLAKMGLILYNSLFTAILVFVIFIIAIVGLAFSVKAISFSRDTLENYRNKYPVFIAITVFNSMFSILLIFINNVSPTLIDVIILGCFIACGILYVIDMAQNTILLAKLESAKNMVKTESMDDEDVTSTENLENSLKKLNELKEQNLITDKELTALREKLIKQEIEKD